MLQSEESEREILLGNKQLLGIFFVVAALLGIAFAGGYKLGQASAAKKAASVANAASNASSETASSATPQGGETHSVAPEESVANATVPSSTGAHRKSEGLLGAPKQKSRSSQATDSSMLIPTKGDGFAPQSGQEFLQVAAVPRDHALAVASVLRKKGFQAHAVAKPGDANLYRVIVGPIRSAGDLSSTRDSLRKTGFSQVIVQHF
jgi:cell division septation protein DedD